MELLKLEKGQRVRLNMSFNGAYEVDVIHQTPKRKFTDILANGVEIRIDTCHVSEILNVEDLKRTKKIGCCHEAGEYMEGLKKYRCKFCEELFDADYFF